MSKNILILTPFFPPNIGGAETFVDGLCQEAKRWFNITVLTFKSFQGQGAAYEEYYYPKGSLKIHRMNWKFSHRSAWAGVSLRNFIVVVPKMLLSAFFLCSVKKYDVIHAQGLLAGLVAVLLKKLFGYKVYITLLALYNFKNWRGVKRRVLKFVLYNCDMIFVEGGNGQKDIEGFVDNSKIRRFNHWCDQKVFFPPRNRPKDKIRVLFVGRPLKAKGRHIVEGAERILNDRNKYEFRYIENVEYKDLPEHYRWVDICCVPSLYDEGFSRVVIEAASCGCVVIASNRGSLPEMVNPFGVVIEPTSENFAKEIFGIWKNSESKSGSYLYAKENFSSKNAEIFLSAYGSL